MPKKSDASPSLNVGETDELDHEPKNEVHLQGRVSSTPVEKQLPSGDLVVEFRIVVERKKTRLNRREVDSINIAVWLARPRKRALALDIDDWVSIEGAIRRRFWHSSGGLASRWQIEASQLQKL